MNKNYLYPHNTTRDPVHQPEGAFQNVGVIHDAAEYYLPPQFDGEPEVIMVSEGNYGQVFTILAAYHAKHPAFGMPFDFEIWQSYHF